MYCVFFSDNHFIKQYSIPHKIISGRDTVSEVYGCRICLEDNDASFAALCGITVVPIEFDTIDNIIINPILQRTENIFVINKIPETKNVLLNNNINHIFFGKEHYGGVQLGIEEYELDKARKHGIEATLVTNNSAFVVDNNPFFRDRLVMIY